MSEAYRAAAISDFNVGTLNRLLANDPSWPEIQPLEAPYAQVHQLLTRADAAVWREEPDFALVWTRPDVQIPSFARLLDGDSVDPAVVDREVDEFVDLLSRLSDRVRFAFVPTWVLEPARAFSMLGLHPGVGPGHALLRMNLRLLERLRLHPGLYPLDTAAWLQVASPFNAKLWYLSKNPFAPEVLKNAVASVKSAVRTAVGRSRKLIVLDLDDTLWGGIVGEVGWPHLRLGGHDAIGEAYADFQSALRGMRQRGILLGLASRNDESVALEAIRRHPEMRLRLEDFAGWRINWGDKAQNIVDLVTGLNLGFDSVVFIDDDPVQRARIRDALPDVLVPDWPRDPTQYRRALLDLDCIDAVSISEEDRQRTGMYQAEQARAASRSADSSLEEWLHTLDVVAVCEPLEEANLSRAAQLLNKTNQLNLSTRRLSESELLGWARTPGRSVWTFRVADRYGDLGLTGLLSMEVEGNRASIVDFLLSCRAMGRKIEETMLSVAVAHAREAGVEAIVARYLPTPRNRPCLEFWENSGWRSGEPGVFHWTASQIYAVPSAVRLEQRAADPARTGEIADTGVA